MSHDSAVVGLPTIVGRAVRSAIAHWPLALALYLPGAIIALASTVPIFLSSSALAHMGPWAARAAEGGYLELVLEMGISEDAARLLPETPPPSDLSAAVASAALGLLLGILGVLLNGLAYTVLSGGILECLAGRRDSGFRGACWRWTWPILRLSAAAVAIFLVVVVAGLELWGLVPGDGPHGTLAKAAVTVVGLSYVDGTIELARASMVVGADPRVMGALSRAVALPAQPALFLRAAAAWVFLAVLGTVYWGIVVAALTAVPAMAVGPAFVLQQVLMLAGAWTKLLRLAVAAGLAGQLTARSRR